MCHESLDCTGRKSLLGKRAQFQMPTKAIGHLIAVPQQVPKSLPAMLRMGVQQVIRATDLSEAPFSPFLLMY